MSHQTNLYDQAVQVSEEYLGPAGERFIRRQITTHLQIEPEDLQASHLPELAEWLHAAFAVLTSDVRYVSEYIEQILRISTGDVSSPLETARENPK